VLLDRYAVAVDGRAGRSTWIEHASTETCGRCGLPRNVASSGCSDAARYCCVALVRISLGTRWPATCAAWWAVVPPALSAGSRLDPDPSGSSRMDIRQADVRRMW